MQDELLYLILLLSLISIGFAGYTFHKVKKIHVSTFKSEVYSDKLALTSYKQIESLLALYWELKPSGALPNMRGWAASPDFLLNLVSVLHKIESPRVILECSSGASTVVIAQYIKNKNLKCRLLSLEDNEFYANETKFKLEKLGLSDYAKVIFAPLTEYIIDDKSWLWYDTSNLSTDYVDLLVVDGPPTSTQKLARYPALPVLKSKNVVVKNILMDDMIRDDEKEIVELWVASEKDAKITFLPAEKGCSLITI